VHDIELPLGDLQVTPRTEGVLRALVDQGLEAGKGVLLVQPQGGGAMQSFSSRRACPGCGRGFPEPDPRLFAWSSARGCGAGSHATGLALRQSAHEQAGEEDRGLDEEAEAGTCVTCDGARLSPVALAVRFRGRASAALAKLSIDELAKFLGGLKL